MFSLLGTELTNTRKIRERERKREREKASSVKVNNIFNSMLSYNVYKKCYIFEIHPIYSL